MQSGVDIMVSRALFSLEAQTPCLEKTWKGPKFLAASLGFDIMPALRYNIDATVDLKLFWLSVNIKNLPHKVLCRVKTSFNSQSTHRQLVSLLFHLEYIVWLLVISCHKSPQKVSYASVKLVWSIVPILWVVGNKEASRLRGIALSS